MTREEHPTRDERAIRDERETQSPDDAHPQILLVEDNPGDVRLIREAFEQSSGESSLTTVTDGENALEYLSRRRDAGSDTVPDLVLLDLNVPKVDGRQVLEAIETDPEQPTVPVLVLSSSTSRETIRETRELGADGYFVKPVAPDEFFALIKTIERSLSTPGRLPRGEYDEIDDGELSRSIR